MSTQCALENGVVSKVNKLASYFRNQDALIIFLKLVSIKVFSQGLGDRILLEFVQSCAKEAHDRDYEVIVVGDACAAAPQEIHLLALVSLGRLVAIHCSEQ